jgi:hypothetical protein
MEAEIGTDESLGGIRRGLIATGQPGIERGEFRFEIVRRNPGGGLGNGKGFEGGAHIVEFVDRLLGQPGDKEAAAGIDLDQADLAETVECFADGGAADPELVGEDLVVEAGARREFEIDDPAPDGIVKRIGHIRDVKWAVGPISMQEIAIPQALCIGHNYPNDNAVSALFEYRLYIVYDLGDGVYGWW